MSNYIQGSHATKSEEFKLLVKREQRIRELIECLETELTISDNQETRDQLTQAMERHTAILNEMFTYSS